MLSCAIVTLSLMIPGPGPLSRRELGLLTGQAGLAVAASFPLPALAGPDALPYQQQPGIKLNTGQAFPYASFGLQVYDDATAQKLTTLALKVGCVGAPGPLPWMSRGRQIAHDPRSDAELVGCDCGPTSRTSDCLQGWRGPGGVGAPCRQATTSIS